MVDWLEQSEDDRKVAAHDGSRKRRTCEVVKATPNGFHLRLEGFLPPSKISSLRFKTETFDSLSRQVSFWGGKKPGSAFVPISDGLGTLRPNNPEGKRLCSRQVISIVSPWSKADQSSSLFQEPLVPFQQYGLSMGMCCSTFTRSESSKCFKVKVSLIVHWRSETTYIGDQIIRINLWSAQQSTSYWCHRNTGGSRSWKTAINWWTRGIHRVLDKYERSENNIIIEALRACISSEGLEWSIYNIHPALRV